MSQFHEGGCVCKAIRYRVKGTPIFTSVCHCTFCQRRTGSAFGIGAYFKEEDVQFVHGRLNAYEHRSDESNRWLRMEFCPTCGTTVSWTVQVRPGLRAIAAGTFDDASWLKVDRHAWVRSARSWTIVPSDVERFEEGSIQQAPPVK